MLSSALDILMRRVARRLHAHDMRLLGIARTQRVARKYNVLRSRLNPDVAPSAAPIAASDRQPTRIAWNDGWAMDLSMSLPHIDSALEACDRVIERSCDGNGRRGDLLRSDDLTTTYPALRDFATAASMLAAAGAALDGVAVLSRAGPAGVQLIAGGTAPHIDQFYHLDCAPAPAVVVVLLLHETTFEHGPWTFLPRSASQLICQRLGYRARVRITHAAGGPGAAARLRDEQAYAIVDRTEAIEFAYPRGSVLLLHTSECLHFAGRATQPCRFLQLCYTTPIRHDFGELVGSPARDH